MAAHREITEILFSLLFLAAAGCTCEKAGLEDGSNTNWLTYCESSADCSDNASCICGLCTRICTTDEECSTGERPASCVDPDPASEAGGCAVVVRDARVKICLPDCTTSDDCGDESVCIRGSCWPTNDDIIDMRGESPFTIDNGQAGSGSGSGSGSGGTAATTDPDAAEPQYTESTPVEIDSALPGHLQELDAAMDFSEPVQLPEPETIITGDFTSSSLAGVWEAPPESTNFGGYFNRLVIEEASDSRGLVGSVMRLCEDGNCNPTGPPPPVTDPDIGYPPELNATEQDMLRVNILPRFDYRIFDGKVGGQRFSFWITNNDLWRDWCALQTPYPVENDGRLEYYCLPDPKPIDPNYYYDPADVNGKELLCALDNSVCACDAEVCGIDFRGSVHSFDLVVNGDVMQGTYIEGPMETWAMIFVRTAGQQP
jgi:hypothetical protein